MPGWMSDVGITSGSVQAAAACAMGGATGEPPPGASATSGSPAAARISAPRSARTTGVERTCMPSSPSESTNREIRLTIRCTTGLQTGQQGLLGQVSGVVVRDEGGDPGRGVQQLREAAVGAADEPAAVVAGQPGGM